MLLSLQKELLLNRILLARLYKMGADWKIEVLAEGCDGTIDDVLKKYGLE